MERKSKQEQLIIKICCFIAAFVLWLYIYNVENPLKDRIVTVPVKIVNQELLASSKLAPVIDGDLTLKITIRGSVSEIYSVKPDEIELEADLKSLALKRGENKIPVTVKGAPSGIKVVGSENLYIKLNVDDLVEKSIPVKVTLKGKAKTGYYAIPPELNNKEVTVKGPSKLISQIQYASAVCNVENASTDLLIKSSLQAESASGVAYDYVILEPDTLDITVPVKKVKTVGVNVKFSGAIDDSTLVKSVLPANANIEIAGNDDTLNSISSIDTEPINIKTLTGQQTIEGKLVLPLGVTVVNNASTVKLNVSYKAPKVKTLSVPVKVRNLDQNLNSEISSTVTVNISGPEGVVSGIGENDIECYVEAQGLAAGTYELQVNTRVPEGISKDSVNPVKVTITLSNKETGGQ